MNIILVIKQNKIYKFYNMYKYYKLLRYQLLLSKHLCNVITHKINTYI